MHRFFLETEDTVKDQSVNIRDKETLKHMVRVLRMPEGEACELVHASGTYIAEIETIDSDAVGLKIIESRNHQNESPVKIDVFQCLPKGQKLELIIQKNVELGVRQFYLVESKRCIVDFKSKDLSKKLDRYNKIAKEAAKQSKRESIPSVVDLIKLKDIIAMKDDYDALIVLYENENKHFLNQVLASKDYQSIGVIIGPEGGFDPSEIDFLEAGGVKVVSLGKRILRTETAGFVAVTCIQYEIGDLNL